VPFLASIPTIQLVWSQIQTRKIVVVSLKGKKKFSSSKRITNAKDRKHEEETQKSKQSEFESFGNVALRGSYYFRAIQSKSSTT
jgi:hypothetical protein